FQNARIQNIESALNRGVWGIDAVATRPGMAVEIAATRQAMQAQADEIASLNAEHTAQVAHQITAMRGLDRPIWNVPYPVMGNAEIDGQITEMLRGKVDGKLPYEALKKLRTAVGQEIENAGLMSDVPR